MYAILDTRALTGALTAEVLALEIACITLITVWAGTAY